MKCKLCGMPMKTQYDSDKSYSFYCDCRKMVPLDEVIEAIDSLTFDLSDEYVNGKTKVCNSNALKIELHKKYEGEVV